MFTVPTKTEPGQAEVCDEDKQPAEVGSLTSEPDFQKENNEEENDAPCGNSEKEDSDVEDLNSNENQAHGTSRLNK